MDINNIIHWDLKIENILLSKWDGVSNEEAFLSNKFMYKIKLADFGLSQELPSKDY